MYRGTERSEVKSNPDTSGLFVGQIPRAFGYAQGKLPFASE